MTCWEARPQMPLFVAEFRLRVYECSQDILSTFQHSQASFLVHLPSGAIRFSVLGSRPSCSQKIFPPDCPFVLIAQHDRKRLSGHKRDNAFVAGTMISTILNHKEAIQRANVAKGVKENDRRQLKK